MKIKADWQKYLHNLRKRQMSVVFADCPSKAFSNALELGAGDGFVSSFLSSYTEKLICTDLNENRLTKSSEDNIEYRIVDAEEVGSVFGEREFDLIFSSNLLEHLPNVEKAIEGMRKVLKDDGICVHLMPNRAWVLVMILLHFPNKVVKNADKLLIKFFGSKEEKGQRAERRNKRVGGNNVKSKKKRQFFLFKPFVARPHGVSDTLFKEFIAFGKSNWIKIFEDAGFEVVAVKPLGFNSGYGFGCPKLRKFLEDKGLATSFAFIICKKNKRNKYNSYFM